MNNLDTNIDSYTIDELFSILDNPVSINEIEENADNYIDKFSKEGNKKLATFFKQVKNTLLQYQ